MRFALLPNFVGFHTSFSQMSLSLFVLIFFLGLGCCLFFFTLCLCFSEIPGLLSTMWQTLGQANSHHSIPAPTSRSDSYPPYLHQQHSTNQDIELRPQVNSQQLQEDLSGDIFESWGPLGSEDEEMPGDLGLGSNMGEEAPLCSQTNMEELRRSCSESQCTAGNINGHVSKRVDSRTEAINGSHLNRYITLVHHLSETKL